MLSSALCGDLDGWHWGLGGEVVRGKAKRKGKVHAKCSSRVLGIRFVRRTSLAAAVGPTHLAGSPRAAAGGDRMRLRGKT